MPVPARLLSREVLPFVASFALLAVLALALDRLLHMFDLLWVGRWLGIPGTLLIIGSTAYWPEQYGERIIPLALRILRGEPVPPAVYMEHTFVSAATGEVERIKT